jgi:hypothetical protein
MLTILKTAFIFYLTVKTLIELLIFVVQECQNKKIWEQLNEEEQLSSCCSERCGGDLKVLLLRELPSNPKNKCLGMNQWLFSDAMGLQVRRNTVYELEPTIYDRNQN